MTITHQRRRVLTPRRIAALALLTLIGFLGGCAGSDENKASDTVHDYLAALADGDGIKACDQLTAAARVSLLSKMNSALPNARLDTCASAVRALREALDPANVDALRDADVETTVMDDRAVSTVTGASNQVRLVRSGDGWQITSTSFAG